MAKQGKRLKAIYAGFDRETAYALTEAVKIAKTNAKAKFDETIEISMNLGIDPRHADQMVRGVVGLPNGTGKTVRVGVFARGAKAEEAHGRRRRRGGCGRPRRDGAGRQDRVRPLHRDAGHDGAWSGRLGKVLGPRGLMPNPKLGTVTMDVKGAVTAAKAGQVEFRAEKAGIVHAGIGKASFGEDALLENARAFVDAIQRARPAGAKGTYVKKAAVSSSMGPGVKVDVTSLSAAADRSSRRLRRDRRRAGVQRDRAQDQRDTPAFRGRRAGGGLGRSRTCRRPPAALRGLESASGRAGDRRGATVMLPGM